MVYNGPTYALQLNEFLLSILDAKVKFPNGADGVLNADQLQVRFHFNFTLTDLDLFD
jgi:hypothetical protein